MKFKYRRRSAFTTLLRLAKFEMDNVDAFFDLAKKARGSEQKALERIAAKTGDNVSDDWLVDDFAQLDDFVSFSAEFAIIGLWRCIELYRKRAMRAALGDAAASLSFRHKAFQNDLSQLGIEEKNIQCARSANELRCLNNSIKHALRVDNELAGFPRWRRKKGSELGNLESHYRRLRPLAERYLTDLANRLDRRLALRNG